MSFKQFSHRRCILPGLLSLIISPSLCQSGSDNNIATLVASNTTAHQHPQQQPDNILQTVFGALKAANFGSPSLLPTTTTTEGESNAPNPLLLIRKSIIDLLNITAALQHNASTTVSGERAQKQLILSKFISIAQLLRPTLTTNDTQRNMSTSVLLPAASAVGEKTSSLSSSAAAEHAQRSARSGYESSGYGEPLFYAQPVHIYEKGSDLIHTLLPTILGQQLKEAANLVGTSGLVFDNLLLDKVMKARDDPLKHLIPILFGLLMLFFSRLPTAG